MSADRDWRAPTENECENDRKYLRYVRLAPDFRLRNLSTSQTMSAWKFEVLMREIERRGIRF